MFRWFCGFDMFILFNFAFRFGGLLLWVVYLNVLVLDFVGFGCTGFGFRGEAFGFSSFCGRIFADRG